jgi:hypothetical protein
MFGRLAHGARRGHAYLPRRVSEMQAKHRWAATDPGRRFDDLCKLVHDPPTLLLSSESRR